MYSPGVSQSEAADLAGGKRVIKLSANENPLGTSPAAAAAVRNLGDLNLYFDETHETLRGTIAARFNLEARNLILGHGSNELIAMICRAFLRGGDEAVMATPTFSLYRIFTAAQDAVPIEIPLQDGVHDIDAMCAAITSRTRVFFICDPNNPTGTILTDEQWNALLERLPPQVLLLVDQAYVDYMGAQMAIRGVLTQRPNTVLLRTMSKIYGLAALRFGYARSSAEVIDVLNGVRVPYNVSLPAAVAAAAALGDVAFVERSLRTNSDGKAFLLSALRELDLHAFPSEANFLSIAVPTAADAAYHDLLSQGIMVRSGDALAMPGRLRVSIGSRSDLEALVAALRIALPGWRR